MTLESGLSLQPDHPFAKLAEALSSSPGLRKETEQAMGAILEKHNPSDRAERFVFGGAIEWVMAVTCWVAGIRSLPGGHGQNGFDLMELKNGIQGLWSLKSSASSKVSGQVNLRNNQRGNSQRDKVQDLYTHPTVFIGPYLPGITYFDPKLAKGYSETFQYDEDAVKFKVSSIVQYAKDNPQMVIPFDFPTNPGLANSEDPNWKIVANILTSGTYSILSAPVKSLQEASEQVRALKSLHVSGKISDSQWQESINKIAEDLDL